MALKSQQRHNQLQKTPKKKLVWKVIECQLSGSAVKLSINTALKLQMLH